MGLRKAFYYNAHKLVKMPIGREYEKMLLEDREGNYRAITRQRLLELLIHAQKSVPYYAGLMENRGGSFQEDPERYLQSFPILTKELIRQHMQRLASQDLSQRKWFYNTSGGSTGEPVEMIQDKDFAAQTGAVQFLSFDWAGRRFGERAIRLWGSERDIIQGSMGWKMKFLNWLTNDEWWNAFRMTPQVMRSFLERINTCPPQLIIAYVQAMYDLALFAQREGLEVRPQKAILTSAGTLHDFMRAKIEAVFGCPVFDRYGSREVGDIASECSAHQGLHIFPWGNYVEVVDEAGQPVPPGVEGDIVITCLTNYAMPLIRYAVGDRGILSPAKRCACGRTGPTFERITGRSGDSFVRADGSRVYGGYFIVMMYHRHWVKKFQIVQKSYQDIHFKIVKTEADWQPGEKQEIIEKSRLVMGPDCQVHFEFVDEILPSPSGKYRYTLSEVKARTSCMTYEEAV